ncbi:MAG: helix-hairpin-helix domain-containing protein [Clostridiales bacterium]|nr:helix-hairpin-helix domain-containing protein [Clostridiales bacterium]
MGVAVCMMAALSAPSLLDDGVKYSEVASDGTSQSVPNVPAPETSVQPAPESASSAQPPSAAGEKISINTANRETLMTLDGIGETLAQRIIDYREIYGDFASVDDLLNVQGIGEKRLAAIRDKITV